MIDYGFYKELDKTFKETAEIVLEKLKEHKFSIVTQIDLKQKFKEKLSIDYKQYTILGLCDPESAYKVLQVEENIGLMLPCNMIVYEKDDKTIIVMMKPSAIMSNLHNPDLDGIAYDVEMRLKDLFDSIQ